MMKAWLKGPPDHPPRWLTASNIVMLVVTPVAIVGNYWIGQTVAMGVCCFVLGVVLMSLLTTNRIFKMARIIGYQSAVMDHMSDDIERRIMLGSMRVFGAPPGLMDDGDDVVTKH